MFVFLCVGASSAVEDKNVPSYQAQARQTQRHTFSDTHSGIICHLISAIHQGLSLLGRVGRGTTGGSKGGTEERPGG